MPTVYARTLRRAAELLGGEGALAARLGVTRDQLDLWLRNFVRPPNDVFLKAADIVGEHELRMLNEQRSVPRN
jgi:transcriptional regulator with XRE-family HTH domain